MPRIKFLLPLFFITLISCGGGGGGSSTAPISNGTTFQAVASEGELVSYTVDTSAMTYSYKIIESAYGKTDVSGNGQLTRNSDGTYTPSGFNGKVAILDSGLLLFTKTSTTMGRERLFPSLACLIRSHLWQKLLTHTTS